MNCFTMPQKAKDICIEPMSQEADTSNAHGPNWTWEELEDIIDILSEQRTIDRLEGRRNKSVYVKIAKGMQVRGHSHDWTQVWCKIKSLRSAFYRAKNGNSHSVAGCTISPFYDKLSIILSKDVGNNLGMETLNTRVGQEEMKEQEAAAPPEGEIMSMSQLYRDCSLLPDDHEWQEEPLVTTHLVPLSPALLTSTDDEVEEVEGQENPCTQYIIYCY
ncbi:hypothetical protein Y1Q_0024379 [Alligator mississippiensis]|uniref:Myb/SANT-like DNA-binding domain-containing protein n=1 Tax=Alligator mississippiensis TaxID=8496 RepID=A0A151NIU5_ALLMI|nr:hypothetical protein Y1Q_0024379 [Alligator mississippiensis]